MIPVATRVSRVLFGLAMLAVLGFGASQAAASPATTQRAVQACADICPRFCASAGYTTWWCYGGYDCICA